MAMIALAGIVSVLVHGDHTLDFISYALAIFLTGLAILAWIKISLKRRNEKINSDIDSTEISVVEELSGEFHNDFSKVPAGKPDNNPLLPRSIGFGYGDHGQAFEEDLAKLGENISKDKSSDEEKNKFILSH